MAFTANINGYIELAPAQLLDNTWRELNFDLGSNQSVLQDYSVPETGGGHVYRNAKQIGSAVHNRFIYWRIYNDVLELVELSTEIVLEDNQVRICFASSPIVGGVNVIEFADFIVLMFATTNSVHRLHLPHPKTTDKSVLQLLTTNVLFDPANYYILNGHDESLKPITTASWHSKTTLKCALSFSDSSLLVVQFALHSHHINTFDIKQNGIIGRLWSKMPHLWAKNPDDCDNAVFVIVPYVLVETNDVLLFTLCRDFKIRVFSTNTRECVYCHNMLPQSSFTQSFASHASPITELPMMKIYKSQIIIYLTENRPEFVFLDYSFSDSQHQLKERITTQAPCWEKLIDFSVTDQKIWALAYIRETETTICYMDLQRMRETSFSDEVTMYEDLWDFVTLPDETEFPASKSLVAEIFWNNHFSLSTIQKALAAVIGPDMPKKNTLEALEELAYTRIVDNDQDDAWMRFYNYCVQNHHVSHKSLGLAIGEDESIVAVIRRAAPSFVCPWITSVDMILQGGPYRGIDFPPNTRAILEPLNFISREIMTDDKSASFEQKLYENPTNVLNSIDDIISSTSKARQSALPKSNSLTKNTLLRDVDYICEQLDLTTHSDQFATKVLSELRSFRSEHNPLSSYCGILVTFELFRRITRGRLILARDLLIYLKFIERQANLDESDQHRADLRDELYISGKIKRLADCLRSYAILVWFAETPIKSHTVPDRSEVIKSISQYFKFFKTPVDINKKNENILDVNLHQNLLMNFLDEGGVLFAWSVSGVSPDQQSLSNSFYVTDAVLNLCKLLWPKSNHLCAAEFMFTQHLDDHLDKYLDMTQEWSCESEPDKHFFRAANCILQDRATHAVEIFNRLWMKPTHDNLLGRFIGFESVKSESPDAKVPINASLKYRYFDKLIQLFHSYSNRRCLVVLINTCMPLIEDPDGEHQSEVNSLRAKLFQYYLELDEFDEAYRTMVLTTDTSLRVNCLRKFIVEHCEKRRWANLLTYPFIDIKHEFIEILHQKAASCDLTQSDDNDFSKPSYYDILFASYISDDAYKRAAEIMYSYSSRLAQEVPGIASIRKQVNCLLIAANSIRCLDPKDRFIEHGLPQKQQDATRSAILKRAHYSESEFNNSITDQEEQRIGNQTVSIMSCEDVERQFELTRARLKLLEKDQTANAIALSPLKPEEIITQLVASSMFCAAMDHAILFRTSMEPIIEGLTSKYILVMRLSAVDIVVNETLEKGLSDLFTDSYSIIDTYNYVANSTAPLVDRLWNLIDYYLNRYDGISHTYHSNEFAKTFGGSTVLMKAVAIKLLSAGYDVPASLKRMYILRNPSELLKLLIKYNRLLDAAGLATEMIDRLLEPAKTLTLPGSMTKSEPSPIYLPTHLIILLITYLNDDATDMPLIKAANALSDKLNKFRSFL